MGSSLGRKPRRESATATVRQVLAEARRAIDAVDARVLLRHALQVGNEALAAHPDRPLTRVEETCFAALVARRAAGEPVAYIVGTREFYGLEFKVTSDVLIPRPETELLVELALERIPEQRLVKVLDLGTGSGAIGVAIAFHRPLAQVTATDASPAALALARENGEHLLFPRGGSFTVALGDWYASVGEEQFAVIVANPPYIAASDAHLQQGDLRFEPLAALVGGADGLENLRVIVAGAASHLHDGGGGWLLCEHGYDQAASVSTLFRNAPFDSVFVASDLSGISRVTGGRWAGH